MQELLRHATIKMTLEVYAQAVTPGQASGAVESRRDVDGESRGKVKHPLLLDLSGPLRIQPKTRKLLE